MRAWNDPRVQSRLLLYARVRRWQALPAAGGLDDQDPATLEALDMIDHVLQSPMDPAAPEAS